MKKVELLAPAGDLSKLKMAILYGADAVYIGGREFSLRTASQNFSPGEMQEGLSFAHERGKKVYVALNIVPKNADLEGIKTYVKELYNLGADGVIVSDLGAFSIVRRTVPDMPVHISTQANTSNFESALMWHSMGAKRIVLARELTLSEIGEIREKLPMECELEAFVHGAMCVSYSGRCLLSNYLANRDSNRGECAQPCRWKYYLMEEKRPGQFMPVFENDTGTFIFNSKDLCMIEHIPKLIKNGVSSFKIEGRVKSEYYVATVVKAYREAIDAYYEKGRDYKFEQKWLDEVGKVSHREYSTGFYLGKPEQIYGYSSYIRNYDIVGIVLSYDEQEKTAVIEQRNRFVKGDTVEFLPPEGDFFEQRIDFIMHEGEETDTAPHPQMIVKIPADRPVVKDTIVRRANKLK